MQVLILGANSDVAQAVARKFAKEEKANLYLASRNMEILQKRAQDIASRFEVEAKPIYFDAIDYDSHAGFYDALNPKPDGVVVAFGYLGDQKEAQSNFKEARKIIDINYIGAVSVLEIIAADFERRGHGFIIGISSVAGERGRQSNYIYGSAKGAFTVYLSGLRNRLFKSGVIVTTILPGFIITKMTEGLNLPKILSADRDAVADTIYKSFKMKRYVVYAKWFWRYIMLVIKIMPNIIFNRLNL